MISKKKKNTYSQYISFKIQLGTVTNLRSLSGIPFDIAPITNSSLLSCRRETSLSKNSDNVLTRRSCFKRRPCQHLYF